MKTMLMISTVLAALLLLSGCRGGDTPNPSGTFEAVEVDISTKVQGQLLQVGPHEGGLVAMGDTLLVVDSTLIALQRAEAEASLVGVAARRDAAVAEQAQVSRSLELARLTYERLHTMGDRGSATAQQVDEARAQQDILIRKVSAAAHNVAVLDAEAARLRTVLALRDRQQEDCVLLAPVEGTVLLRTAEPGEVTSPGQVALRLADLRQLELRFYLDETEMGLVRLGQELPVQVDAFPERSFQGTVTWISSEAEFTPKNAQTRDARAQLVYAVKLKVENSDGALSIGMPAEVLVGR